MNAIDSRIPYKLAKTLLHKITKGFSNPFSLITVDKYY